MDTDEADKKMRENAVDLDGWRTRAVNMRADVTEELANLVPVLGSDWVLTLSERNFEYLRQQAENMLNYQYSLTLRLRQNSPSVAT